MLIAKKKALLPIFHFYEEDHYFGTLRAAFVKPKAIFIAREGNYRFYREKWLEGTYYCMLHNTYKGIAEKFHGTGDAFWIKYQSVTYSFKPGKHFREQTAYHFELFKKDQQIGVFAGNYGKYTLSLTENNELSNIIQCFIFWLGYRLLASTRCWRLSTLGTRALRGF